MTPSDYEVLVRLDGNAGRDALAAAAGEHADLIRRFLLNHLDEQERQVIADATDRLSVHMRVHRRREQCELCSD